MSRAVSRACGPAGSLGVQLQELLSLPGCELRYGGFYVDRFDYNNYFREGFRRGYEDGYYDRYQYGGYSDGRTSILAAVLGSIWCSRLFARPGARFGW